MINDQVVESIATRLSHSSKRISLEVAEPIISTLHFVVLIIYLHGALSEQITTASMNESKMDLNIFDQYITPISLLAIRREL